jgi:di/tricarboxylate transporter
LEILLLLVIITGSTTLYVTRRLPTEVTAVLTVVALAATGILSPGQAFSGFSNTATVTVAAMFVLSGGLMRTGALESITVQLARFSQGKPIRLLSILGLTIPPISAFVNNTPIVVLMVPVILSLSRRFGVRPSKLLIPVSYYAILGGTVTLLGTSTNILVATLYQRASGDTLGLFDFTPLGLLYAIIGVTYIVLFGPRLLPDRPHLADIGGLARNTTYVTEIVVSQNSKLVGQKPDRWFSLTASPGRKGTAPFIHRRRRIGMPPPLIPTVTKSPEQPELLQISRGQEIVQSDEVGELSLAPHDVLLVAGDPQSIQKLLDGTRSKLTTATQDQPQPPIRLLTEHVVEAVVLHTSSYAGRTIGSLDFYERYGVKVMGIQHRGRQYRTTLRDLVLETGDVLLLQGERTGLRAACEAGRLLIAEGIEETMVRSQKNWLALAIMAAVVVLASFSSMPVVMLALSGALIMILTRCLRVDEALRSLDAPTLFLLAGTIPLGLAMEQTGLAQIIVSGVLQVTGHASPILFLSVFYLLTSLLTEIVSNNAVAVLLTPIALQLSLTLGIDPKPLIMAIAFGASASFMTPMGYQTNAIVMGPGGYTFKDYFKFGLPLNLLMWITATIFIPLLWPL